jgi:hypothetical protein
MPALDLQAGALDEDVVVVRPQKSDEAPPAEMAGKALPRESSAEAAVKTIKTEPADEEGNASAASITPAAVVLQIEPMIEGDRKADPAENLSHLLRLSGDLRKAATSGTVALLECGADPIVPDEQGESALRIALNSDDVTPFDALVVRAPPAKVASPVSPQKLGWPPLGGTVALLAAMSRQTTRW